MQAVILAAGKSSRFYPFTKSFSHKSLVSLLGKPIIAHTLESISKSGIKDLVIVISKNSDIEKTLGDGKKYGIEIKYVVQNEPNGGGNGLLLCEKLIEKDFFLINASRVDFENYYKEMVSKKSQLTSAVLLGRKQSDLGKYGALEIEGDRVLDLIEKPSSSDSALDTRLVGVYLFDRSIFEILRKSQDHHYRLESAISSLAKKKDVRLVITDKEVPSLKYSWDLLGLKNYLLLSISGQKISKSARIAKSAEIIGDVVIEDGANVLEGARVKGPCFIGKNSIVGNNAIVRDGTSIEEGCVVGANMELRNSLIMKNTKVHSGFIGDCVIGEGVRIGADFHTANKRIDRKSVSVLSPDGEVVSTGLVGLGSIIGNNVKIGIKSSTMPGVVVGEDSIIGPSTTVIKNVPANSKYYTKFQETITKNK